MSVPLPSNSYRAGSLYFRWSIFCFCVFLFGTGVQAQKGQIVFTDVSAGSGIDVPNISTPENRYIVESMSGGVAVFDCDNDGYLDVVTVNGSSVRPL